MVENLDSDFVVYLNRSMYRHGYAQAAHFRYETNRVSGGSTIVKLIQ